MVAGAAGSSGGAARSIAAVGPPISSVTVGTDRNERSVVVGGWLSPGGGLSTGTARFGRDCRCSSVGEVSFVGTCEFAVLTVCAVGASESAERL